MVTDRVSQILNGGGHVVDPVFKRVETLAPSVLFPSVPRPIVIFRRRLFHRVPSRICG